MNDRGAESRMRARLGWCGVWCSFRAVAAVVIWGLGLLLHEPLVKYGNTPNNAYSQGDQELTSSEGAC
jgi:hypothetical protein